MAAFRRGELWRWDSSSSPPLFRFRGCTRQKAGASSSLHMAIASRDELAPAARRAFSSAREICGLADSEEHQQHLKSAFVRLPRIIPYAEMAPRFALRNSSRHTCMKSPKHHARNHNGSNAPASIAHPALKLSSPPSRATGAGSRASPSLEMHHRSSPLAMFRRSLLSLNATIRCGKPKSWHRYNGKFGGKSPVSNRRAGD